MRKEKIWTFYLLKYIFTIVANVTPYSKKEYEQNQPKYVGTGSVVDGTVEIRVIPNWLS